MINEWYIRKYVCCEELSLIENYDKAINDKTQTWDLHHRLETDLGLSRQELIDTGRYYKVEAKYLIFLTHSEHLSIHGKLKIGYKNGFYGKGVSGEANPNYGSHRTEEQKQHMRKPHIKGTTALKHPKQKHKYITPSGEIVEMCNFNAERWHPDWKLIE